MNTGSGAGTGTGRGLEHVRTFFVCGFRNATRIRFVRGVRNASAGQAAFTIAISGSGGTNGFFKTPSAPTRCASCLIQRIERANQQKSPEYVSKPDPASRTGKLHTRCAPA